MTVLKRGELAKRCGVDIETIRYYEKRKLLNPPPRSPSGYRLFPEEDVVKIRFIKSAQSLGFTLAEIMELLKLRVQKGRNCSSVLKKTQIKLMEVEKKIDRLKSMKKALKRLSLSCQQEASTIDCPILSSFEAGQAI